MKSNNIDSSKLIVTKKRARGNNKTEETLYISHVIVKTLLRLMTEITRDKN
jgi:hypothetical protein